MIPSPVVTAEELRHHWYAVALSDDVSPGPLATRVLGTDFVIWRDLAGELTAAIDRCPHRESPLSTGQVVDGCVECPYHGWRFGTGGRCTLVPSSGPEATIPSRADLALARVSEAYGLVWLCPDEPHTSVPPIPQDDDPRYRRINPYTQRWAVSFTRMVDNFLDISHFPFVHTGTFGLAQRTEVPTIEITELDDGYVGYEYEVVVNNDDVGKAMTGLQAETVHRQMSTGFVLPTTVRSTMNYETGLHHVLLLLTTPVDEAHAIFHFVVWRNDDETVSAEEVLKFELAVGLEDQMMLESLNGELPMDQTETVSVQSDRPSVEWRRQFAALVTVD